MIDPEGIFKFQSQSKLPEGVAHVLTWVVPTNLPYFDGHFPQNPVLPAVAVLDGTLEALKLLQQNKTLSFERIKSGKFLNLIKPGTPLQICLTQIRKNEWEAEWGSPDGEKIFAHLKVLLRSDGN